MNSLLKFGLIISMLCGPVWAQDRPQPGEKKAESETALQSQRSLDPAEESKLRYAGAQHEIISILINEGQYSRVPAEFQKIAELNFAAENEELVVAEVWWIIERLRAVGQTKIALNVIDTALSHTTTGDSKYNLWMFKGKVFKDAGQLQEAIRAFRQSQKFRTP